jgi:hypothetical protein
MTGHWPCLSVSAPGLGSIFGLVALAGALVVCLRLNYRLDYNLNQRLRDLWVQINGLF